MSDTLRWATELDASGFASGAQRVNSSLGEMGFRTSAAQMNLGGLGTMLYGLANPLTLVAAGAMAVGAALAGSVQAAAAWQTQMAEVSKTTGVAGKDLEELSATLQDIRMRTGASASAISGSVVTAGSIGIPTEELAAFAEVSLQMASAFRMDADVAAEAMGKIGNVVKPAEMAWVEFMERAGSSVNILADTMATSEAEILTGMKHLGATMALLKPPIDTVPSWQALVATVQSLGLSADTAGEAIQDAFQYAARDAKGGISALLGVTSGELQTMLRTDAVGAMEEFAKAIAALPIEEQAEALKMFGMTGQKAVSLLMGDLDKTTGGFTKLDKAIKDSNMAWEDAEGLAAAYGKSQDTFAVSMDKFQASIEVAATKLGTVLLPILAKFLDDMAALTVGTIKAGEAFSKWGSENWDKFEAGADKAGGWLVETFGGVDDYKKMGTDAGKASGEAYANQMTEEIKNSDLAKAPGEALSSPEAIAEVQKAANAYGVIMSDPVYWQDIPIAQSIDAETGRVYDQIGADWKKTQGEIYGTVDVGGVEIAAVGNATHDSTDIILKTAGGQEIDRRSIYTGEFAGDSMGAIYDMIKSNPEEFGNLTELESAEFAGDIQTAETLKIAAAGVDVEMTTEARLKELSSIDLDVMKTNIREIESEISGLARSIGDIDLAFETLSVDPVDLIVSLDTNAAYTAWGHLVQDIEALHPVMHVNVEVDANAQDIAAKVEAAIVEALA